MKRYLLGITIALSSFLVVNAQKISDMGAAEQWCDMTMLDKIEGIWEYPDDDTRVLIRKSTVDRNKYEIVTVESPDTRISPGDVIGYLKISPDPDKFEMGVYRTKLKNGVFSELGKCYAQFNEKDGAIQVKGRSVKFSLGSRWLLPSFWKLIRISVKNPLEALPKGLVKIYPEKKRTQPDYL